MEKLPIIDLSGFASGESFDRVVAEIAAAARGPGFFYLVNHGVPLELMDRAFDESRAFFARPIAEKDAIAIDKIGGNRDRKPVLARYAANRRRFGGRRGLRHHQMSRRFGWSHNHAGP